LRLINTGGTRPRDGFEIYSVEGNADGSVTLLWASVEGARFAVESSLDLKTWLELDDNIDSEGETTNFATSAGEAEKTFYRVTQLTP